MKKTLFIICLLTNFIINAQNSSFEKFSLEPYLGLNLQKQPENTLTNNFFVNGYGGLKVNYEMGQRFSVNLGLGLSDRRQQYKSLDTNSVIEEYRFFLELAGVDVDQIKETLKQNGFKLDRYTETMGIAKILQLEVPFSLSYTWKSFQFDVGGYLGFLLSSKKNEQANSRIPLLESVELDSIDQSGQISSFLPAANSSSLEELSNSDNLNVMFYGFRFGVAYQYKSNVKFYGNYSLDLNSYKIDENNLLTNNHSFFRVGVAYRIKSLKVNEEGNSKARFE